MPSAKEEQAIAALREKLQREPENKEARGALTVALHNVAYAEAGRRRYEDAIELYREAIGLVDNHAVMHLNLGVALAAIGRLEEAEAAYRRAIQLNAEYFEAHNNLGNLLKERGNFDGGLVSLSRAAKLRPQSGFVYSNMGMLLLEMGQHDAAMSYQRKAVELEPQCAEIHSGYLYMMQMHPSVDGAMMRRELEVFGRRHGQGPAASIRPHDVAPSPERKLRVGYVSADFREHVLGRILLPILAQHNREAVETYCYSSVGKPDAMTARFSAAAQKWREIAFLSDDQVAAQIRLDQVDILVDLGLHTLGSRMLVFARKPAPVQATWLAYPGSSGLKTMDYRLSDPHLDPEEADASMYTETTLRLAETYWCYQPIEGGSDSADGKAEDKSRVGGGEGITFGCLNNFSKVPTSALEVWARILAAVPGSRLLVHAPAGTSRERARQFLVSKGVAGERCTFVDHMSAREYLARYREIDVALDPFPYAGGITTCDALWMGVPVVTLKGRMAVGRGGASILSNIGAGELIAATPKEYMELAVKLAADAGRRAEYRKTLRGKLEHSPLMDAARFAKNLEAAYRTMWQNWCGKPASGGSR